MKKISIILLSTILIFTIFYSFKKNNNKLNSEINVSTSSKVEPKKSCSVNILVNRGINFAKKQNFQKAIDFFNEAQNALKLNGYKINEGDIMDLPGLINEFKINKKPIVFNFFRLLPLELQNKIKDFKSSKEINKEFELEFINAINEILKNFELDKVFEIKNIPFKIMHCNIYPPEKKIYTNRVYLSLEFNKFISTPLLESEIAVNKAIVLTNLGNFEEAIKVLNDILFQNKFLEKVYILLSINYENLKKFEEAIKILENGLQLFPDNEDLLIELARQYFKIKKTVLAKETLEKVLTINPKNKYSLEGLKIIERKTDNVLKDSKFYENELKNDPNNIIILSNFALSLMAEQNYVEAEKITSKALLVNPDDLFLLKLKSRIEGYKNNYRETVNILLKAKQIAGNSDPEIFLLLGITYFNQNLLNEAYETLKYALNIFKQDPYIILNLAKVCEMTPGKILESISLYEKYLEILPAAKNKQKVLNKISDLNSQAAFPTT